MGTVSFLLCAGDGAAAEFCETGAAIARALAGRGLLGGSQELRGLLLLPDPPFAPTLAGSLDSGTHALRRQAERLRKAARKRMSAPNLSRILVAPDLAERPDTLGPLLAGLRAGAREAQIAVALPVATAPGIKAGDTALRSRPAYLRACRETDLVIGGAGLAALERAAAGLVQILIPDGPAEQRLADVMDRTGAAMKLNPGDDVAAAIECAVHDLAVMPVMLRLMAESALALSRRLVPEEACGAITGLLSAQGANPSTMSGLRGSA